jgi:cytochrome c peroxidase
MGPRGAALLLVSVAASAAAGEPVTVLAPGYTRLEFPAPVPGTYHLPPLWEAADGQVLDTAGKPTRLRALMGDKVVVMSFIYTQCNDVNGCPLATFVLSQLQAPIQLDPALRDQVRLVTLSFDPQRDTPEVMASYGRSFRQEDFDWSFLTCASSSELAPLLASYDQSTQFIEGEEDVISHVLRVFLIDKSRRVRNIYNTSFLHAETVLSDIHTVLGQR